ncbi:MAG: hypothetical protein V2J10_05300, partial [Wenzhouxiangella sp.]|nr:hypothetical protein [Wenzhouxiangella sp.]
MHRFDRILLCLLTTSLCAIAIHLVVPASPARAEVYWQQSEAQAATRQQNVAVCAIQHVIGELMKSD